MRITTTSQHQGADSIDVASARGVLYECAQDIDGASKDANGFHMPLGGESGELWLTVRIADRSDPGWRGYKYELIAYPHKGDPNFSIDDHCYDRDRPCFYETRGSFEVARLKEALADAIEWGRGL